MSYSPPVMKSIRLRENNRVISNAVLSTDTMQLTGFLSLKLESGGKAYTRFIALDAIEEMVIENEELYKTLPCSFVPEVRLRANIEGGKM